MTHAIRTLLIATALGMASQTASAAFSVEIYQGAGPITTLGGATGFITGSPTFSDTPEVVNYIDKNADNNGVHGLFLDDESRFPGDVFKEFAMRATATIEIETAGTYTFGFDSDDGAELSIDGGVVVSDTTVHPRRTALGQTTLGIGTYDLELIYWENGGRATIELFAALGAYTLATFDVSDFELVGSADGIATVGAPVPLPSSVVLFAGGLLGLVLKRRSLKPSAI